MIWPALGVSSPSLQMVLNRCAHAGAHDARHARARPQLRPRLPTCTLARHRRRHRSPATSAGLGPRTPLIFHVDRANIHVYISLYFYISYYCRFLIYF